jgi:hypothetical protein
MRRRIIPIVLILIAVLWPNLTVHADDVEVIDGGTVNKPVTHGANQSIEPTDTAAPAPPKFGGDAKIQGPGGPIKVTDQKEPKDLFEGANRLLSPNTYQTKIVPPDPAKQAVTISKIKQCVTQSDKPGTEIRISDNNVKTEPLPLIGQINAAFRTFGAMFSRYEISPAETGKYKGKYVQDWNPQEVKAPPDGCSPDTTSNPEISLVAPWVRNLGNIDIITVIFNWILGTFQDKSASQAITSRTFWPHADQNDCLINGCHDDSTALNDISDSKDKAVTQTAGGFANTFVPVDVKYVPDKGKTNGEQQNQLCVGGTCDNQITRDTYAAANVASGKTVKCTILPFSKQTVQGLEAPDCNPINPTGTVTPKDCDSYFKDPVPDAEAKTGGSASGGALGFNIPFRNPSCVFQNKDAVAKYASAWLGGSSAAESAVNQYFDTIVKYAQEYNWSPAYIMTLWIEETAAGAIGAQEMGCLYRHNNSYPNGWKGLPKDSGTCEQLACVIDYPHYPTFQNFMCAYSGESSANCSVTAENPCHAVNIYRAYQDLTNRAGLPSGCEETGAPSQAVMDLYTSKCVGGAPRTSPAAAPAPTGMVHF